MTDPYTKALFGENAIHIPFNAVVQAAGNPYGLPETHTIVSILGQSTSKGDAHPIMFGSKATHQLVLGDMVFRPHIVLESDAFRGHGAAGLITMSPAAWLREPHKIIINNTNDLDKRLRI